MGNAIKIVAPATRDAAVGTLINQAGQASASMYSLAKQAAQGAAVQLDKSLKLGDRIAAVMVLYSADFVAAGHNVKAIFRDALTLLAAGAEPVIVAVIGKDGKKIDQRSTAAEALDASKHAMREAAKQVREVNGMARASGGGRKVTTKPVTTAANDAVTASDVDAFAAWLENLPAYVQDAVYHPRIVARLIEAGFVLSKASTARKVTGKASA